jgi:hypothetical protein
MVSDQLYTLTASPPIPIIIGPWVDPTANVDVLAKKEIPWSCRELNRNYAHIPKMPNGGARRLFTCFLPYIGPNINNNNNNNNNNNILMNPPEDGRVTPETCRGIYS